MKGKTNQLIDRVPNFGFMYKRGKCWRKGKGKRKIAPNIYVPKEGLDNYRETFPPSRSQPHQPRTAPPPLQPHPHKYDQPTHAALPPHHRFVEARPRPRTPLRHVDRKRLHEAPGHDRVLALEGELKVPEGDGDAFPGGEVGELAGFDLEGEDGVEVFEVLGGEGGGEDGEGSCEFRVEARGGCWGGAGV